MFASFWACMAGAGAAWLGTAVVVIALGLAAARGDRRGHRRVR